MTLPAPRQPEPRHAPPQVRRLLLVRHGLPDYRQRKAGDEPPGPELSETGQLQAAQAAPTVARYAPTAIYASPLARTRHTAAIVAQAVGVPVQIVSDLKEWHRSESLYEVSVRTARWLGQWLRTSEHCAVAVGHASPLLAIIRTALFLPHASWWRAGRPDLFQLDTVDRFELSMASVFSITFEPHRVTAECIFHPTPRIVDAQFGWKRRIPRPTTHSPENKRITRQNLLHLTVGQT